ncbi:VUT family protein [Streptomyces phytophilus]|uniref:VUT family protein n=1 Tax=Streptomyces phytophilus TaxID=722715 RepID=UPI002867FF94|nr:VUT family protein [Streptomyces phytophilus]
MKSWMKATAVLAGYIATIPVANWLVAHVDPQPVGLGYVAPAGVYMVGLVLVLRDAVRETVGRPAVAVAIAAGAVLSFWLATPALAFASAAAFALSETADSLVYEPLRKRGRLTAVAASNAVGLVADSLLFLWLAFGSFTYLPGQLLGKAWMTLAALAVIAVWRSRRKAVAA